MDAQDLKYWLALHSINGMGAATFQKLLDKFGSPAQIVSATKESLYSIPRLTNAIIEQICALKTRMTEIEVLALRLDELGVKVLTIFDNDYPAILKGVKNPPPLIYLYGRFLEADQNSIAIVGSRNATEKGLQIARGFAKRFALRNYTIVSGYARGIDIESHLGALEGNGRTILVLSNGIFHFKLRNAGFESFEFLKQRGAVISEMFPTESWSVGAAMARNRLVVGLSKAVLVIECKLKSGTMNAALLAKQMNKPLFVLQYQEKGEHLLGNQALLEAGAIPIRKFNDIQIIEQAIMS